MDSDDEVVSRPSVSTFDGGVLVSSPYALRLPKPEVTGDVSQDHDLGLKHRQGCAEVHHSYSEGLEFGFKDLACS